MMFLYVFIVAAVCGNYFTAAAPRPPVTVNDEGAFLRELLHKLDKKTLISWLEKRDSEASIFDTNEPENKGEEEMITTPAIPTYAPEVIATSLPASQKILPHPVCKDRLTDPDQIKDIDDIKNRHDIIEYLIYRLCLPTVDSKDVLAVSAIVDHLQWPTRKPVVGLPNTFVPEANTLIVDMEEGVTEAVQEQTQRPILDQEMPGTRVMAIDSDIDDAGVTAVADENDAQTEETGGEGGNLFGFLLNKVGDTISKFPHLIGNQEEDEEKDEGNDKRDEPALVTDAPYLMTTSLPAPGETILYPLCKDRLDNPDQIKSIGDIKNRYDVIEYLLYRLCLPTVTEDDIAAVATVVEQLSMPFATQPNPIVEPEVQTMLIDIDGDDKIESDQEPTTKPLDGNDKGDAKLDDVQLTAVTTTPTLSIVDQLKIDLDRCMNKLRVRENKQNRAKNNPKNKPAEQAPSATPIPSNPMEMDDDVIDEEAVTTVQLLNGEQDDLDELEMIVRDLLDELLI